MDYIYILVDCDGDSWNPVVRDIGHYRTEEAAVNDIPGLDSLRDYEREPINAYSNPDRTTVRHFGYFKVDRVRLLG